jgi:hypothetical protein
MSYKIVNATTIQRLSDGLLIPTQMRNRAYREYLAWVDAGNTTTPADPPPPPPADWPGFLAALKASDVFTMLRAESRVDTAVNALATELRLELTDAARGAPDVAALEGLVGELSPLLTAPQRAGIDTLLAAYHVPLDPLT